MRRSLAVVLSASLLLSFVPKEAAAVNISVPKTGPAVSVPRIALPSGGMSVLNVSHAGLQGSLAPTSIVAAARLSPLPSALPVAVQAVSVPAPLSRAAVPSDAPKAVSAHIALKPAQAVPTGALAPLQAAAETLSSPADGPRADPSSSLDPLFTGAPKRADGADAVPAREGAPAAASRLEAATPSRPGALARAKTAALDLVGWNKPFVTAPAPDAPVDWKVFGGLLLQRLPSMAAYMLVTIAFVAIAVPVVGWGGYGILISLSPMAGIAASNIMGSVVKNMSARDAMALNTVLRVVSLMALPTFHYFGVVNLGTLLLGALAEGWLLSSILTTEGSFVKVLFPAKQLSSINGAMFQMFPAVQVILGLFLGFGHYADVLDPFLVFTIAALVNLLIVLPIVWFVIPRVRLTDAAPSKPAERLALRALAFAKRYWKEALLLAAGIAAFAALAGPLSTLPFLVAYPGLKSALPITLALLYWISRIDAFKRLRSGADAEPSAARDAAAAAGDQDEVARQDGRQWKAVKLMSLGTMMYYPLYLIAAPHVAELLAGPELKGALIGQFLGALFFGSWLSTAARTKLPELRVPFTAKTIGAHRLVQAGVAALAGLWVAGKILPGAWAAGLLASLLAVGLMALAERVTDRFWVKFVGLGFATVLLPFAVWLWPTLLPFLSVQNAMFISLIAAGVFNGPSFLSLVIYLQKNTRKEASSQITGVQGSLFNASVSIGYALLTIASGFFNPAYPLVLGVMGAMNVLIGLLFWRAPKDLPGLPDTLLVPKAKKA